MKRISKIISLMLLLLPILSSCNGEYDQPPVTLPEGGIGSGTWDKPMTVYQVSLGSTNDTLNSVWVKGYIVGYVDVDIATTLKAETAKFTAPATVKTNILLASNPSETNWENCIPVQLPSGSVRTALNLYDNSDNLGKLVCILGTSGSKYCSAYGLKSASAYNWGETGIEGMNDVVTPSTPSDTPSVSGATIYTALSSSDTELSEGWTYENVNMDSALSYVWSWKAYNSSYYLNASAYLNSTAYESEAYAVSPEISLDGYTSVSASFEHAAKYQTTLLDLCGFVVREAGTTEWTKLEIPTWPGTISWTFVNSGEIDLSAYAGKTIQVAFKYGSSSAGADTWEIKTLKITGSK